MTNEDVIKFLKRKLKDEEGRIGIELETDGDSGRHASIYSRFIYGYGGDDFIYVKNESDHRVMFSEITEMMFFNENDYDYDTEHCKWGKGRHPELYPFLKELYIIDDEGWDLRELTDEEVILAQEYFSKLHPKDRPRGKHLSNFKKGKFNYKDTENIKIYSILKKSTKEIQDLFLNYASEIYEEYYNDKIERDYAYEIRGVSKSDVIKMVEEMLK